MATFEEIKAMLAGKKQSNNFEKKPFYKFPPGTDEVKLRILPAWEGSEAPFKPTMQHFGIPGSDKPLPCLRLHGLECPICEVLAKYEGQSKELYQYQTKSGAAVNVLVRKDDTQKINAKEPMPARLSEAQLEFCINLLSEGDITDPYEGRDIIVKRKKYNGAFEMRPAFSASSIGDDQADIESILTKLTNFDTHMFFQKPNDDDINMVLKCARELDDMIENKILAHGTSNGGVSDHSDEDSAPTAEEKPGKLVKKPEATKPVTKPAATVARPAATNTGTVAKPVSKPAAAAPASTVTKPGATKPATVAKPAAAKVENAPAGAPECFGLVGEYVENSEKCTKCEYEYQCQGVVAAAK